MELERCHDCGVTPGHIHLTGCDVERCSICGRQRISCDCVGHNPFLTAWTGVWPGDEINSKARNENVSWTEREIEVLGDMLRGVPTETGVIRCILKKVKLWLDVQYSRTNG